MNDEHETTEAAPVAEHIPVAPVSEHHDEADRLRERNADLTAENAHLRSQIAEFLTTVSDAIDELPERVVQTIRALPQRREATPTAPTSAASTPEAKTVAAPPTADRGRPHVHPGHGKHHSRFAQKYWGVDAEGYRTR